MASLTVLRLSRFACRRARREDEEPCWGCNTLLNIILYRSILMLGISTSRSARGIAGIGGGEDGGTGVLSALFFFESPRRPLRVILRAIPPDPGSFGFVSFDALIGVVVFSFPALDGEVMASLGV